MLNGDGDPRTVELEDYLERAVETVLAEEAPTIARLQGSRLYWVETSPVFLYAVGVGMAICLYPFLDGFFSQLGSRVADSLWDQVEEQ